MRGACEGGRDAGASVAGRTEGYAINFGVKQYAL
jgi:hypothetical protein